MEDQSMPQTSAPPPNLPTKELPKEKEGTVQQNLSVPAEKPSSSQPVSIACEAVQKYDDELTSRILDNGMTVSESEKMFDSGARVPMEVMIDIIADLQAKIARLERIAELLYWTKEKTVTTPHSAELSNELDRIFKYKTL